MKLFSPRISTPTVVAISLVMLMSLISMPGIYGFNKAAGGGHTIGTLCAGYQSWTDIPRSQQERIRQLATQAGTKHAVLMLLGQHIPVSLLLILTVCIISQSASNEFKRSLRQCFLLISLIGMFFLSLALTSSGQEDSFAQSFGVSFLLYLVVAVLLWSVIGIAGLMKKQCIKIHSSRHDNG